MQLQTVFRAGNSNVVAIPKTLGDKYNISQGKKVMVDEILNVGIIIKKATKPNVSVTESAVSSEFKKWLKEATKEDAEILDQLA